MSAAGLFLIGVPVAFNATFAALAKRFDYPDVLRRPPRSGCWPPPSSSSA